VRVRIVEFEEPGLILKPRFGDQFTITYGEVLTAERLRNGVGLLLHTRTTDPLRVRVRGRELVETTNRLRAYGVRIVDRWGAILAPTLADFEEELDRRPGPVRQSSDNA
jgi:hypothetical protein